MIREFSEIWQILKILQIFILHVKNLNICNKSPDFILLVIKINICVKKGSNCEINKWRGGQIYKVFWQNFGNILKICILQVKKIEYL